MNALKSYLDGQPDPAAAYKDFAKRCGIRVGYLKFLTQSLQRGPGRPLARVMEMESGGALRAIDLLSVGKAKRTKAKK